nr:putative ribonuclease h protein [Quercus suber]
MQTLQEIDSKLNKFDVMEGVDGNSEVLPNKESSCPTKPVTEATYVRRTTQPLVTCISPSRVNRSEWSPLANLSNSLNSPTCTPLPPKPSWTCVNCIPYVSKEKLEMWLEDSSCKETMEWTWDRSVTGSPMEVVVTKLDACQKSLSQWSKHSFCHDFVENLPQVNTEERSFWKKLWKIQVSGKIKQFLWKACTNSLATKENLVKRKILTEAVCTRCSSASEDVLHSLWSCNGLKEVWEKDFGGVFRTGLVFTSFWNLVEHIFTKPEKAALFAMTVWFVWYHRNMTRLNESTRSLGQIAGFMRDFFRDRKSLYHRSSHVRKASPRRWSPPARENWKTNFDGAMFGEFDEAGPHQAPLSENRALTRSLDKVNPDSLPQNISNAASYPIFRDLEDSLPGFRGQLNGEVNFMQTLQEIDSKLNKFNVMEGVDGNSEVLPSKESSCLTKPVTEATYMWLEDSICKETMEWTWDRSVTGSPVEVVVTKLDACQKSLSQWSKHSFCHARREISEKKKVLKVAEREATQGKNVERILLKICLKSTLKKGVSGRSFGKFRCSSASEDVLHSLWSCNGLKEVWEKDFGGVFRTGLVFTSFWNLVEHIFTKPEKAALFVMIVWSVWYHRNMTRLNESTRLLGQIAGFTPDFFRDSETDLRAAIYDLRRAATKGKRRSTTRANDEGGASRERAMTTRGEQSATERAARPAPASDVTVSPWVLGNGVWFDFDLYRLYWGLVYSANEVTDF